MYEINKKWIIVGAIIVAFVVIYTEIRLYVYEAHSLRTDMENLKADQSKIASWINMVIAKQNGK